ncbi:MAG: hypothetical protein K2I46_01685, partial [Clostridia bacterium]|nr:hypothetical protein [Clostridia bacterium]
MTARKKLVSTICIISLILAITAGVLLSVGAQSNGNNYVGATTNLVNTDVTVNASTSTVGGGTDKPAEAPADAVAIGNATELQTFLSGTASYGYLTNNIVLDWSGTGTDVVFAEGRTINGNGNTVTLQDETGTANGYKDNLRTISGAGAGGVNYGMFVAYNEGTIKNIVFKFDSSITLTNNGVVAPNYAGLVCGTNAPTGVISNCDLYASGKFTY